MPDTMHDYTPNQAATWVAGIVTSFLSQGDDAIDRQVRESRRMASLSRKSGADQAMPLATRAHDLVADELQAHLDSRHPKAAPAQASTAPAAKAGAVRPKAEPRQSRAQTVGKLPTDSGRTESDIMANRRMVELLRERGEGGATMAELQAAAGFRSPPGRQWIEKLAGRNGFLLEMPKGDAGVTKFVATWDAADEEAGA